MKTETFIHILDELQQEAALWQAPVIDYLAALTKDPYQVLIATVLSLRTKDEVTGKAMQRLFAEADTPSKMMKLSRERIEKLIYPVGFYRTKSTTILDISAVLLKDHKGKVPAGLDALLALKGVGRKTANLVLAQGFGLPAICVDTHVHRISNRLGMVKTKSPDETELALRKKVPQEQWIRINTLFVAFGQTVCRPVSPHCSRCRVASLCPQTGVKGSR